MAAPAPSAPGPHEDQGVMSPTGARRAIDSRLEGETAGPRYDRHPAGNAMPNGVLSADVVRREDMVQASPGAASLESAPWPPAMTSRTEDVGPPGTFSCDSGLRQETSSVSAGNVGPTIPHLVARASTDNHPGGSQGGTALPVPSWMSRLGDYLRQASGQVETLTTTLTRSVGTDDASSASIPVELVQEEVRRQVEAALAGQKGRLERLQEENERLREMAFGGGGDVKGQGRGGALWNEAQRQMREQSEIVVYLMEIGPTQHLMHFVRIVVYLMEIGPLSLMHLVRIVVYLMEIGPTQHLMHFLRIVVYLMVVNQFRRCLGPMMVLVHRGAKLVPGQEVQKDMASLGTGQGMCMLVVMVPSDLPQRVRRQVVVEELWVRGSEQQPGDVAPAAPSSPSPMDIVLTGIGQLQQMLLKKGDGLDVDKASPNFPMLPDYTPESGAIDFQDWLYLVEQQVSAMAASAGEWWKQVMGSALEAYQEYQALSPIKQIGVKARLSEELQDGKYQKLAKKVAALLLAALPTGVRDELVAYRVQGTHQILFRLMAVYQPGGAQDRAQLLKQLEVSESPGTATDAVVALRRWYRLYQRALDLGVSLPDESVQVKSLGVLTKKVAETNQDFRFKVSLAKAELQIDTRPTSENVLKYFQHLLAECEQLGATGRKATPSQASEAPGPKLKGMQQQPSDAGNTTQRPKAKAFVGGSSASRTVPPLWFDEAQGKGLSYEEGPSVPAGDATREQPSSLTPSTSNKIDTEQVAAMLSETNKMLKDLRRLRMLVVLPERVGNEDFRVKMDVYERLLQTEPEAVEKDSEEKMALLDSGASHAFRVAVDDREVEQGKLVKVALANDDHVVLSQNAGGTLLSSPSTNPSGGGTILPMGQLVQLLGCTVRWSPTRLEVRHPIHGKLRVKVNHFCPELTEVSALQLIKELEEKRVGEFTKTLEDMERQLKEIELSGCGDRGWEQHLMDLVETGARTSFCGFIQKVPYLQGVTPEAFATIPEEFPVTNKEGWRLLKGMPWSRRKRRSMFLSNNWLVHLFSGDKRKKGLASSSEWKASLHRDDVLVEVDLNLSSHFDMLKKDGIFKLLLWGAARGKIKALFGGPPRRTFPFTGNETMLSSQHVREVQLVARAMILWSVASEGRRILWREGSLETPGPGVGWLLEHPRVESGKVPGLEQGDNKESDLEEQERLAKEWFDLGKFSHRECRMLLEEMNFKKNLRASSRGEQEGSVVLGAYAHGGNRGVTTEALQRPWLTKYLNMFMRWNVETQLHEDCSWSALLVMETNEVPRHRDVRNARDSNNYLIGLGDDDPGREVSSGLWLEGDLDGQNGLGDDDPGREVSSGLWLEGDLDGQKFGGGGRCVERSCPFSGFEQLKGCLVEISGRMTRFNPKQHHAYVGKDQTQKELLVAAYTPLGLDKLPDEKVGKLRCLGFPIRSTLEWDEGPALHGRDQVREAQEELESEDEEEANGRVPCYDLFGTTMWKTFARMYTMDEVKCDLENLGPTTLGTNLNLWSLEGEDGHGLKAGTRTSRWPTGMISSVCDALCAWPGFATREHALTSMVRRLGRRDGEEGEGKLAKFSLEEWRIHLRRDHLPYRKDCRECIQRATGKPHRRVAHPSAYVLSIDTAGPFRATGTDGARYLLVGCFRFPKIPETGDPEQSGVQPGDVDKPDDEGDWLPGMEGEDVVSEVPATEGAPVGVSEELGPDPAAIREEDDPKQEEIKALERMSEPFEFESAYLCRPLKTRKKAETLKALQEMYLSLRQRGLPVLRVHCDRAREFMNEGMDMWAAARDIIVTKTQGDDPSQNGAAERAVGFIKGRVRTLLGQAKAYSKLGDAVVRSWWSRAASTICQQHAAQAFGRGNPSVAPFGSQVFIKRKRYGQGGTDFEDKWIQGSYLGPVETVSHGHVVRTVQGNVWYTTNVRRLPELPPYEDEGDDWHPERRVVGKTPPVVRVFRADEGGEDGNVFCMSRLVEPVSTTTDAVPDNETTEGWMESAGGEDAGDDMDESQWLVEDQEGEMDGRYWSRCVLDEEHNLRRCVPEDYQELFEGVNQATLEAERALEQRESQKVYKTYSVGDWFRLCRFVEDDDGKHGVEPVLENLEGPLQVVYTVQLDEVKQFLPRWKEAIGKEMKALLDAGALVPLTEEEHRRLERAGVLSILPAKGVFTAKPPDNPELLDDPGRELVKGSPSFFKRKARLVICGNFEGRSQKEDSYAGGCQGESLRAMIVHAAHKRGGSRPWKAAGTDIRNAFILAPMDDGEVVHCLYPPKVFQAAEIPFAKCLFRVDRALYGFRRSPKLWSTFRDNRLRRARFKVGELDAFLRQHRADENVWSVVVMTPGPDGTMQEEVRAFVNVYVDDILYLGEEEVVAATHGWITQEWKASDLTWASMEQPVRFLGLEIYETLNGFKIGQTGYISEVLRHYDVQGHGHGTPCPQSWLLGEVNFDEKQYDEQTLRRAQKITGELLWLSTKGRPDLIHTVATMSSLCVRDPETVERIGMRTLGYLKATADWFLFYEPTTHNHDVEGYSDASFAPQGGRSIGCSLACYLGCPISWRCGRQPLVSLSVAEAELIEAVNAIQMVYGLSSFTSEIRQLELGKLVTYEFVPFIFVRYKGLLEAKTPGALPYVGIGNNFAKRDVGGIQISVAWEFYALVFVSLVAAIGAWEAIKWLFECYALKSLGGTALHPLQKGAVRTRDANTQTPREAYVKFRGPFFASQRGDHVHLYGDCQGLKSAYTNIDAKGMCAYCDGRKSLYELVG
ncbi:GIP [Symbiodinium natans]|uniref:GIP protein n=2 Tax=Symbiodinium natans TaxID=878477 RepID=A0A812Q769_9DINO|nr:GIP [Symbiodinium natans]